MTLSGLHLPRPRRLRIPPRLLAGIPAVGENTWTAHEPAAVTSPLSLFDPIYLGCDLYGAPVGVTMAYRNLLCGGVTDSGKSNGAAQVIAHAALCPDVRMWFFDGKWVELGFWQPLAERFIGPVLPDAIDTLTELCRRLDERYEWLLSTGRRKLTPDESAGWDLVVVDELSLFTATVALRLLAATNRVVGFGPTATMPRAGVDLARHADIVAQVTEAALGNAAA